MAIAESFSIHQEMLLVGTNISYNKTNNKKNFLFMVGKIINFIEVSICCKNLNKLFYYKK